MRFQRKIRWGGLVTPWLLALGLIASLLTLEPGAALALADAESSAAQISASQNSASQISAAQFRASQPSGAQLFENHCVGCHLQGGNIIRRGKTLKLAALQRNGIADAEAVAAIARAGVGQMSGYAEVLGDEGVSVVAAYVWQQAEAGWPKEPRGS
ncbi:c-type cytochrome [Synechococcus sp. CS-1328]|uniref:c-type cytochrome n=1 Tax=Synechococcus sp. CS-1328 TaxID=2847976 RepID=UPI002880BB51|nr:c-type cytochrome [Synechococcus sp. CS-1328]